MPSTKTECTELAVGFGLLGIEPIGQTNRQIQVSFDGTLSIAKYQDFARAYAPKESYYSRFYRIGSVIRRAHSTFAAANITTLKWEGPRQQARTGSGAKDLIAVNTPISVKADSHVVFNFSPHKLFIGIPCGTPSPQRGENWYLVSAPDKYQVCYAFMQEGYFAEYPQDVRDYHRRIRKPARKVLRQVIGNLTGAESARFNELYLDFSREVAVCSARMFNNNLAASLTSPGRNEVIENLIRNFFRIAESSYVLCGLDEGKEFAVQIPDLTSWKREWRFKSLVAAPDVARGQSIVLFNLKVENRQTRQEEEFVYEVQIRWSHGKFEGNPEAKFYKKFSWNSVPFFTSLMGAGVPIRNEIIGEGTFGIVYSAIDPETRNAIAVKELSVNTVTYEDRQRFEREIQIQGELDHPNILPILSSDLSCSTPWFTAPLAASNLADEIDNLKNDLPALCHVYLQVLSAIAYAHSEDVIHRDIKPENILLFDNGRVMVCDFGLGKHTNSSSMEHVLTRTSESMGSIHYAAPEQLESFSTSDHRADIYALGKLLYIIMTGVLPFPTLRLDLVPEGFREIISQCTEVERGKRYQSVNDLAVAFEKVMVAKGLSTT